MCARSVPALQHTEALHHVLTTPSGFWACTVSKRPRVPSLRAAPAPGVQLLPQLGMSNELEEPEAEASEGGWEEAHVNGAGGDTGEEGPEEATMEAELADEIEAQVSLVSSSP